MKIINLSVIVTASLGFAAMADAKPIKGNEFAGQARLTLGAARIVALKARPGTITDQELEKEPGGTGLRYSFDITSKGKPYEVGVDAKTGALLENVPESKNPVAGFSLLVRRATIGGPPKGP